MSPALAARTERTAREIAAEWDLRLGPRILAGRYSYVAPVGDDMILKVVPPEDDDADEIADALRLWDGHGAVRLLRYDAARRALLLERVVPGYDAASLSEDEAISVAIDVGRKIWVGVPATHHFRPIHRWVRRWLPPDETHPLVPVARRMYESMDPRLDRLAHTDLHHYNLLRRGDEWIAIDPKPYIGEPEFDIISFLANPSTAEPTLERTERRIRAFADAGLDGERIRAWAIVRGVLDGLPSRPGEPESRRMNIARSLI